ncbi:MAG: CHAT domain-containing protein [Anaerolineae bacterium]
MGRVQFEDFELRIGRGQGESYPTWVVRSPAGEANGTFSLPFGPKRLKDIKTLVELAMLRSRQRTRAALSSELRELKAFGGDLFDALFNNAIRGVYDSSRNLALTQGKGLRLKLRIEPGELIDLPWEFLYDKAARRFVALSTRTPVVRYVELEAPLPPLKLTPPLHLLVVVASPLDYAPLNVEREKHRIRLALSELITRGLVQVDFLPNATVPALQDRLRENPVHILHFIGHGSYFEERETGVLVFENEHGEGQRVHGEQLRHLFGDVLTLRLVVLNACSGARGWDSEQDPLRAYPGIAESLVHEGIAGVVANQFEVTDEAAIILARELYSALADGFPIDAAVAEARKAIDLSLKNTVEWASPVLYSRAPDGLIFDVPEVVTATPAPEAKPEPVYAPELTSSPAASISGLLGTEINKTGHPKDGSLVDLTSTPDSKRQSGRINHRLRLGALGVLGVLLFMVGFAAASAVPRLTHPSTLPPSSLVEPSATPTATPTPTAEPTKSVASYRASPSLTMSLTNTGSPTSKPKPTSRVSALPAMIMAAKEGYSSYNLREGPSTHCPIVGSIPSGTHVQARGGWSSTDDARYPTGWGWILIETEAGRRAWVWGTAVRLAESGAALSEMSEDDIPPCVPLHEPLPYAATPAPSLPPSSVADLSGSPVQARPTATPEPTAVPTATPTEPVSSAPTPSTVRGIPRPPTPTPTRTGY